MSICHEYDFAGNFASYENNENEVLFICIWIKVDNVSLKN